jgi:large subunit ribosomal protein L9
VATAISAQAGVEIDRKMIELDESIRSTGSHSVTIKPHAEVQFPIMVTVVEA